VAAGVLLSADADGVSFAGTRYANVCFFQRHFGVPCPTCGMTRSVVLTLHGQLGTALRINPAGPLWVLAAIAVSGGLIVLEWRPEETTRRWVRRLAFAAGIGFLAVLAGHWVWASGCLQDFSRGVVAGGAHDAAAGMRAGAA
jgi:disulfide bond formation protein DsbB